MQRAPPSDGAPPAYTRFLPRRVSSSNSLRPAVMMVAFFSAGIPMFAYRKLIILVNVSHGIDYKLGTVYAIFAAAAVIRRRNETDTSAKLDTVYLVMAIMYFVVSAIEWFGFAAAYKQSIRLVRYYFWSTATAALIVTAAEILRIVVHFTDKTAIQAACRAGEKQDSPNATDADVNDYCSWTWRRSTYWDVGLLIFSILLSVLFASLAGAYLHQLLNPQLLRTHRPQFGSATGAPSSQYAYPLQAYPPNPYSLDPPVGGFGYAAPPYAAGGLPEYSNDSGFVATDDKERGHLQSPSAVARDPFSDDGGMTSQEYEQRQHDEEMRRRAQESTETVTLEPRSDREREGRV